MIHGFYRPRVETHSHVEVVRASPTICFETLVDFTHYPDWFAMMHKAEIEEADPAAGRWVVAYEINAIVRTIRYTLAYESRAPHDLAWTLVRGDLKDIRGSYALAELEPGLTEVTCTQSLDIGLWVPGPLRRTFEQSALADSVREFKKAAEARASA